MTHFTAFRFTDNDFHAPLKKAIDYVIENRTEELSLDAMKEFVLRAMVGFANISRIDEWSFENSKQTDRREYFESKLVVTEVRKLSELDPGFEGYVYNHFAPIATAVNYHGY